MPTRTSSRFGHTIHRGRCCSWQMRTRSGQRSGAIRDYLRAATCYRSCGPASSSWTECSKQTRVAGRARGPPEPAVRISAGPLNELVKDSVTLTESIRRPSWSRGLRPSFCRSVSLLGARPPDRVCETDSDRSESAARRRHVRSLQAARGQRAAWNRVTQVVTCSSRSAG